MNTDAMTMNSCLECATKHITMARIQYDEYRQSPHDNATDLINCVGNLGCAELHLIDSFPELSSACREVRKTIMAKNKVDEVLFDSVVISVCNASGLLDDPEHNDLDKSDGV